MSTTSHQQSALTPHVDNSMDVFLEKFPFDDYPSMFAQASQMKRQFTVILGPTNSGKTHKALQALIAAESGAYLGPLRLLALEGQERINAAGVPCSLRTGEERIDVYGAAHVASTVELADLATPIDVAIIDEIQMLQDPDRGWAWTSAICGVPARHVFLLGSPDIGPTIERLLKRLKASYNIVRTQRLSPLEEEATFVPIEKIRAGDAVVAFSRKEVFVIQELLGQRGITSAVIYGALGPEVRRAEAARFRTGDAQVLIATDAIGMGLNLPIMRVIFADAWKYNGTENVPISPMLTKQIAGRAGRYGVTDREVGAYAGMDPDTHEHVVEMVKIVTPLSVTPIFVVPMPMQLAAFAQAAQIKDPVAALTEFGRRFLSDKKDIFAPGWSQDRLERLEMLRPFANDLGVPTTIALAQAPVPTGDVVERFYWAAVRSIANNKPMTLWHVADGGEEGAHALLRTITGSESVYQVASLYSWLHKAFGSRFPEHVEAAEWRVRAADNLIALLRSRAKAIVVEPKNKKKKSGRGS